MPHDIAHRDAVEVAFEQTYECLLRSYRRICSFAAIAQEQTKVTAGQRRHHQEMIGADTVVKVIGPIREAIQVNIEILKKAARVVLALDGHSKAAAYARIDTVCGDE